LTLKWRFRPGIRRSSIVLILALFFCSLQPAIAQTRKELEKKRKSILTEIKQTNKLLEKTTKEQKTELQRFNMLQSQVQKREELVSTIRNEIKSIDRSIDVNKKETETLQAEIDRLLAEYSRILKKTYKLKVSTDPLLLIFSATNLNQALQRWMYVNQIKKMRASQAIVIKEKTEALQEKINQLQNYKREQSKLLASEVNQKLKLSNELEEKDELLVSLKKDEQKFKRILNEKEIAQQKVNSEIQRLIAIEIERQKKEAAAKALAEEKARKEKAAREAKELELAAAKAKETPTEKPAVTANKTTPAKTAEPKVVSNKVVTKPAAIPATPEITKLSNDFAKNRGSLPWPVQKGTISRRFGKQAHPVLSSISITNNGVDIRTEKSSGVRSVFDGVVIGKKLIPGANYMVLIQHGKYYTVYSNLSDVHVKEGQKLKTGEMIGTVASDEEDPYAEVHFEIWNEKTLQDPSAWLKR
jgi:septal ring factor EnvC (AmiA/AmiB activator)